MTANGDGTNLSSWDVAVEFTGDQAAALVIGHDPAGEGYIRTTSTPIYQHMKRSYELKVKWLWGDMGPHEDGIIATLDMLESIDLARWACHVEPGSWSDFCSWSKDDKKSGFCTQRISRDEIKRWLDVVGVNSIYRFDLKPADQCIGAESASVGKPSGTQKRWTPELLAELKTYKDANGAKSAAAKYKVSESRIRHLLSKEKPKHRSHWSV